MAHFSILPHPMTRQPAVISSRMIGAFLAGGLLFAAAWITPDETLRIIFAVTAAALLISAITVWLTFLSSSWHQRIKLSEISKFVEHDATASFVSDEDGTVRYLNYAGKRTFPAKIGQPLSHAFNEVFANPSNVMHGLQIRALRKGAAREDVVTRKGHMRLAVHRLGGNGFLWRFEDIWEPHKASKGSDGLSLPMVICNANGAVLFSNEALRRLLGERVKSIHTIATEEQLEEGGLIELQTQSGALNCELVVIKGLGGRQEVYFVPPRESDFSADKYDHLDDLPVSILLLDKSFSVKFANSSARKLLKTESSLVGIEAAGFLEGINRPLEDWLFQGGATFREPRDELLKMRASDQEIFVHATVLQKGADLMMVLNDVTELKTLEAQFVQSQKMQAIGQLAGGIAHDFNNLLTAISGHCDLLLLRHDHNDPSYADLEQISQNANRAASLVGQLLAFSRKQTMQMQPMDLKDVFSDLTHLLNRLVGEKVSLRFGYDPEIKPVFADKRQLEQVMMNLVVNAKEAMPDGGEISIETTGATLRNGMRKGRVTIPPADYCVIKVTDNGVGIPTDNIDKVFDPFFTDKPIGEGTGLGLATVYGIVKQTGGYILIDSAVGQGTCFTLYLPVASEETVDRFTVQPKALEKPSPADEGVVLLVEDEDSVRAFASRALRLRGYTVLEAEDAERAKAILDDDSLSVDVFVSDVIMPGANGPTWVREALAKRPNVKVIFVSGYTEEELSKEGEMVPNSVFLPKPFSLNDLTSTVHRQLH